MMDESDEGRNQNSKKDGKKRKTLRSNSIKEKNKGKKREGKSKTVPKGKGRGIDPANSALNVVQTDSDRNASKDQSITLNLKFIRDHSIDQIISLKTGFTLSKQAILVLTSGLEYIASEIIAEALRKSPRNRIRPLTLYNTIREDSDFVDLFSKHQIIDSRKDKKGTHYLTSYQI